MLEWASRPAGMAPPLFVPSRAPARIAWITGLTLLLCDKTAPLLLSPQTGWHFAATARWVWLAFAAAGDGWCLRSNDGRWMHQATWTVLSKFSASPASRSEQTRCTIRVVMTAGAGSCD